jgi:hypothetical protein
MRIYVTIRNIPLTSWGNEMIFREDRKIINLTKIIKIYNIN